MVFKGFIDLQVNGYGGVDFSAPGLTIEDVQKATKEFVKTGTWAYCPTVITSDVELIKKNVATIVEAHAEEPFKTHFLGIHVEGPFISPEDGYRGAHRKEFVIPPSLSVYREIQEAASGHVVMLTIAPEIVGSMEFIKEVSKDTNISIGHSNASDLEVYKAADNGLTLATHLGNGAKNIVPRHPNVAQAIMVDDRIMAGIITDGHHIGETFINLCLKTKGVGNLYVTCDCAGIAGYPPGNYHCFGQDVVISETGRLSLASGDYLAGSASNTFQCMNHLAKISDLGFEELYAMGVQNSLKAIDQTMPEGEGLCQTSITFDKDKREFTIN